jgi:hypothetical protein
MGFRRRICFSSAFDACGPDPPVCPAELAPRGTLFRFPGARSRKILLLGFERRTFLFLPFDLFPATVTLSALLFGVGTLFLSRSTQLRVALERLRPLMCALRTPSIQGASSSPHLPSCGCGMRNGKAPHVLHSNHDSTMGRNDFPLRSALLD